MANICPCTLGNSVSQALNNLRSAKKLKEIPPEQTANATVLSRKVDTCYSLTKSDSSWAYLVRFRLESGEELELKVTEADYKKLKEGTSLSITWRGDTLTSLQSERSLHMGWNPYQDQKNRAYSSILTSLFPEQTKTLPRIFIWSVIFLADLIAIIGGCYALGWLEGFSKIAILLMIAACVGVFWLQGVLWGWISKLFTKKEETWL